MHALIIITVPSHAGEKPRTPLSLSTNMNTGVGGASLALGPKSTTKAEYVIGTNVGRSPVSVFVSGSGFGARSRSWSGYISSSSPSLSESTNGCWSNQSTVRAAHDQECGVIAGLSTKHLVHNPDHLVPCIIRVHARA
jgi:hypothetical protein